MKWYRSLKPHLVIATYHIQNVSPRRSLESDVMTGMQWCRNSSDLSDNRTFLMNVRQKNVGVPDQMPDRNYKRISI